MKSMRLIITCLAVAIPAAAVAATSPASAPQHPRIADGTVDETTFQWESAMAVAAADPCATYFAPPYFNHGDESNYDDFGNDLRKEFGLTI